MAENNFNILEHYNPSILTSTNSNNTAASFKPIKGLEEKILQHIEQELFKITENLERLVEQKTQELQKQNEETNKFVLKIEVAFAIISIVSLLVNLFFAIYVAEKFDASVFSFIIIAITMVLFLVSMLFCLRIEQKAGFYVCKICGHKHVPTYNQVNMAMHVGRLRYMKCPKCGKKSWNKKVLK